MSEPRPADLPALLRALLGEVPTLSLATVDDAGRPHAANVNFALDGKLRPFFFSSPDSAHARHLARMRAVAATAYASFQTAEQIRGLQIHGTCAEVEPREFEALWPVFLARFPYAAAFERRAREEDRCYRIEPEWVRLIDNRVRFGFKLEARWGEWGGR